MGLYLVNAFLNLISSQEFFKKVLFKKNGLVLQRNLSVDTAFQVDTLLTDVHPVTQCGMPAMSHSCIYAMEWFWSPVMRQSFIFLMPYPSSPSRPHGSGPQGESASGRGVVADDC